MKKSIMMTIITLMILGLLILAGCTEENKVSNNSFIGSWEHDYSNVIIKPNSTEIWEFKDIVSLETRTTSQTNPPQIITRYYNWSITNNTLCITNAREPTESPNCYYYTFDNNGMTVKLRLVNSPDSKYLILNKQ
jgi:hypothetical protein